MIPVFGADTGDEELAAVAACLREHWMGMGPRVAEFEQRFAARLGLPGLVMLDNGSNALQLAIHLLDLPRGAEVILPSFTWVSCAHAVVLCGCRPVFCDVDLATHNVTADTVRPHLSARTGAILVVDYAGKPVHLGPILALGPPVVEDAAHAVDSQCDGVACGARGALGVYSFDAVKNLAAPDAGAITARDPRLLERARQLRYCGIAGSGFAASAERSRWWGNTAFSKPSPASRPTTSQPPSPWPNSAGSTACKPVVAPSGSVTRRTSPASPGWSAPSMPNPPNGTRSSPIASV